MKRERATRSFPALIVGRLRRDVPLIVLDIAIALCAYMVAMVLRFEGAVPDLYWENYLRFAPVAAAVHVLANYAFGLYGQMWRYASVQEARQLLLAGITAILGILAGSELGNPEEGRVFPLSVVAVGAGLSLVGFGAVRFQSRLFAFRRRTAVQESTLFLLVGAGDAGAMILRDLRRHPELGLQPVGVVDDDPRKVGRTFLGVPILGTREAIPTLVKRLQADQVLLAIPSATSEVVREIVDLCEAAEVGVRILPSVKEIVNGRVTARDIRDLRIEDLLGRQLVTTDLGAVRSIIEGRTVLITGAGGSIGAEICRQVLEFDPATLVALDRDEIHLHDLVTGLEPGAPVRTALADVRDGEHIRQLMDRYRPQVVFHTAAHKHLPMLERHPREAVLTNVLGTVAVAEAAVAAGAERFLFISTDKAVKPTSIMGASKRLAEQMVWTLAGNGCILSVVRFGNVVGSRGGVIQTFLQQINQGRSVTVTDAQMARYFMSIQEAVQLVLQAAAMSRGGEVFTLEMGEPIRIMDLARELIRLSGRVPGKDVEIEMVGPRPGEKLVEDLVDPREAPGPSAHPSIMVSRPPLPDVQALQALVRRLEQLAQHGDEEELAEWLRMATFSQPEAGIGAGIRQGIR